MRIRVSYWVAAAAFLAVAAPVACSVEAGGLPGILGSDSGPDGFNPADVVQNDASMDAGTDTFVPDSSPGVDAADAYVPPTAATPLDLADAGLVLWVRGDKVTVTDAGTVSTWPDQSGLGHDLGQPNPTLQPKAQATTAAYNNQPTVHFAQFEAIQTVGALTVGQPSTVLIVGEAGSDNAYYFDCKDPTSRLSILVTAGRKAELYSTAGYAPGNGVGYVGVPTAVVAELNNASSSLYLSSNTPTFPLNVAPGVSCSGVTIGNWNGGIYGLQGSVAEAAIWSSALSAFAVARVNLYIKARYGITIQ